VEEREEKEGEDGEEFRMTLGCVVRGVGGYATVTFFRHLLGEWSNAARGREGRKERGRKGEKKGAGIQHGHKIHTGGGHFACEFGVLRPHYRARQSKATERKGRRKTGERGKREGKGQESRNRFLPQSPIPVTGPG